MNKFRRQRDLVGRWIPIVLIALLASVLSLPSQPSHAAAASLQIGWWTGAGISDLTRIDVQKVAGETLQTAYYVTDPSAYLTKLQQGGIKTFLALDFAAAKAANTAALVSIVNTYKTHPAITGWLLYDEPEFNGVSDTALISDYQAIKAADPNHPVAIVFGNSFCSYAIQNPNYMNALDVLMFDKYPVSDQPEFGTSSNNKYSFVGFNSYSYTVNDCLSFAQRYGKTFMMVTQGFNWGGTGPAGLPSRNPTYNEERYLTFMPLIHNASGLLYWVDYRADAILTATVNQVMKEASSVGVVLQNGVMNAPSVSVNNSAISYKYGSDGTNTYLIAENDTASSVTVNFSLPSSSGATGVAVLYDGFNGGTYQSRNIQTVSDSSGRPTFSDTFTQFQVHIYRLSSGVVINPSPTPTATKVPPSATPVTPTATKVPPSATPVTPTATKVPPSATPVTPTATKVPPSATPVTPTATKVPPSATPVTPTATKVPPSATPVTPTATKVPPSATPVTPTATKVLPSATPVTLTVAVAIPGNGTGLTGQYYNARNFTSLKLTRVDPTINFQWGNNAPAPSIGRNTFSIRWLGQIQSLYSQVYTFYGTSDDGVRLWINNQLIVDSWGPHGAMESSGTIALTAGQKYDIKIEYHQEYGSSTMQLSWSSQSQAKQVVPASQLYPMAANAVVTNNTSDTNSAPAALAPAENTAASTSVPANPVSANVAPATSTTPAPIASTGTGLTGQYYDTDHGTSLKVTRVDPVVDFHWLGNSPDPSLTTKKFLVRWTGQIQPVYSESYTFYVTSDSGARLWINNQLILDNWEHSILDRASSPINVIAGQKYDIKLDYQGRRGRAIVSLSWSSSSQPKQVVPQSQLYPTNTPAAVSAQANAQPAPDNTQNQNGLSVPLGLPPGSQPQPGSDGGVPLGPPPGNQPQPGSVPLGPPPQ